MVGSRWEHPRIVIYSQDGLGLGHQRRTSAIAAECGRRLPGSSVLVLADSPLGAPFGSIPGHDYVKLPSIRKVRPGIWEPVSLSVAFTEVAALRRALIRDAVLGFAPDVFLVDHMPHGAMGELVDTLEALRRARPDTRVVLGLRDIIDDPAVVRRVWGEEGAYEALASFYDRVLVYGERRLFDAAEAYEFAPSIALRTRHCGYVCTPQRARYTARVRDQYRLPGVPLIVAMAGGGADGYPVLRALVDALPAVQAQRPATAVLVTGPFMPVEARRDIEARGERCGATVKVSVSDSLSYIEAADLVVVMAGYNTSVEVLRVGTPALIVPRVGPSAEQRMRAARFAAQGWVDALDPLRLDPSTVAQAVLRGLETEQAAPATRPDLGGLGAACKDLLGLLDAPVSAPSPNGAVPQAAVGPPRTGT